MNRYVYFCLILSVVFAGLFVADTYGAFDKRIHPIATLKKATRTVRRLPRDELTWERARQGSTLELGDTLSTGDRAQAQILFDAGGLLTLEPGSMVVLSGGPEELHLDFVSGQAHLQVTKDSEHKFKIKTQHKEHKSELSRLRSAIEVSFVEDKKLLESVEKIVERKPLPQPQLITPADGSHMGFMETREKPVQLKWATYNTVKNYHVTVEGEKDILLEKNATSNQLELPPLSSGSYRWTVFALSDDLKHSGEMSSRQFYIGEAPRIVWSELYSQKTYYYITQQPSLKLAWTVKNLPPNWKSKFQVTILRAPTDILATKSTSDLSYEQNLPERGQYTAQVALLDSKGKPILSSDNLDLKIDYRPPLSAPEVSKRIPASLTASANSPTLFEWTVVVGAKAYLVRVQDPRKRVIREEKVEVPKTVLKGLRPGDYEVTVAAIDEYGRPGSFMPEKAIHILSNLKAPELKRLEIK